MEMNLYVRILCGRRSERLRRVSLLIRGTEHHQPSSFSFCPFWVAENMVCKPSFAATCHTYIPLLSYLSPTIQPEKNSKIYS